MTGLSTAEVEARRQRGDGNKVKLTTSRTYSDIIRTNAFSPINLVLYAIGIGMILVGDMRSAIATVMLVLFNAVVGIVQEVLAKRKLDQIALVARAKVTVWRDDKEQQVDPDELVLGDVLVIHAGDQIPIDGTVASDGTLEVDESALTGESDSIFKHKGDQVLSGSFCISGEALVEATRVGEKSFANELTENARKFKLEQTPLQRDVNGLLRILLLIVLFFGILLVLALFVLKLPIDTWLNLMAVITGSISAGLLVFITLNYSWGSVRIGRQGGLVQQINAVESLSNVTVLCTDKTGTLTANKIHFDQVMPVGIEQVTLEQRLADFAASASTTNKTTEAIIAYKAGTAHKPVDEVPFSSARKWSALAFDTASGMPGVYVLGAFEMLESQLAPNPAAVQKIKSWSDQGLRVLVFAHNPDAKTLHDSGGQLVLPPLTLLGVVSFSDELRPHLKDTLLAFEKNGVRLKVISGDNPETVAVLAKQAGLQGDLRVVSGPQLATMDPAQFADAAEDATIFGRITPQQKEQLVDALRSRGEYVAMIGDGVNDVLSLKKADLGIAMESGTTATRAVAGMVLMNDSFEVMPKAVHEGRRIVASIQNILKLYMVTVFALLLLMMAIGFLQIGFPFTAPQNTLLSFFARRAAPAILSLTAVATMSRTRLAVNILHFTLPSSFLMFFFGLLLYTSIFLLTKYTLTRVVLSQEMMQIVARAAGVAANTLTEARFNELAVQYSAQTTLVTFFVLTGVSLMVFADPPVRWLAGGSPSYGHWLPTFAALGLIAAYYVLLLVPGLRAFFELVPLSIGLHLVILATALLWAITQHFFWYWCLLERFLGIPVQLGEALTGANSKRPAGSGAPVKTAAPVKPA